MTKQLSQMPLIAGRFRIAILKFTSFIGFLSGAPKIRATFKKYSVRSTTALRLLPVLLHSLMFCRTDHLSRRCLCKAECDGKEPPASTGVCLFSALFNMYNRVFYLRAAVLFRHARRSKDTAYH